ncbi:MULTISPECIES: hypothetical protein [unclassified Nonomuraea]|uniref:hypothetical protein n=1 Tax=unclassified Nonomuraea TaxID=2593643 RepID=UPI0033D3CCC7
MGGSGQHRWITWPAKTSQDFESFAVLGHGLSDAELTRAANGPAQRHILIGFAGTGVRKVRISYSDGTSAELPLGPAGGPGGVRWFSAEVKSRSFKLSAEMKDGKVSNTVRRIP